MSDASAVLCLSPFGFDLHRAPPSSLRIIGKGDDNSSLTRTLTVPIFTSALKALNSVKNAKISSSNRIMRGRDR